MPCQSFGGRAGGLPRAIPTQLIEHLRDIRSQRSFDFHRIARSGMLKTQTPGV
ncbi:MAG: hypothetical protein HQ581_13335 [Planctomycetes bacterium]|nr:hypothetical protein [Planctomycetota bacterium]